MNLNDIFRIFKRREAVPDKNRDDIYELNEINRDEDSDPFLHSLKTLTPDDIAPKPQKKKRSASDIVNDLIRRGIIIACAGVFVWSATTIVRSFVDYKRGDDLYGAIAENIFDSDLGSVKRAVSFSLQSKQNSTLPDYYTGLTAEMSDDAYEIESLSRNVKFEQMKSNLTYLKSINPDIYGYIYIDGTKISFPIVQSDDNDYYLDHAYTGEYMIVGSIFADFRAYKNMDYNRNTVFYGHNMNDGNMFNNVMNFLDKDVFNSTLIEIYTFDGIYTYEPFAIFDTISTFQYFTMYFETDDDFVAFCEQMQSKSNFNKKMTFTGDDQIITLSTCTNVGNGRYALHAKLVNVEK